MKMPSSLLTLTQILLLITGSLAKVIPSNQTSGRNELTIVSREEWKARPPTSIEDMDVPVPYVVIHHSYIPAACTSNATCVEAMQEMQDMHMDDNGWVDIGYSFAVGGDGRIYQGRGWNRVGAHAPGYNDRSIGICTIGDWRTKLPPHKQLAALERLIESGVQTGKISNNYKLIGHRQTRDTECPGQTLFNEINSWKNYSPTPIFISKKTITNKN